MDQSVETQNQKRTRICWRNEAINKTFLEACINEITINGRFGSSLKPQSWMKVAEVLKKTHNFDVDGKQMRNRYDYLKSRYIAWCLLKTKTGNHYDPTTNTFNFTEEEWKQHSQANAYVNSLKTAPLIFPELCINLFDGAAATGVSGWGPSSKKNRTIDLSDDLESLDTEDVSFHSDMNSPINSAFTGINSNATNPQDEEERPKKKHKKSSKLSNSSQLEDKMTSVLDLMIQNNNGPTLQECKEKLNKLGWGSRNPLHQMALGIFCESATYRGQWMLLDEDENEQWVRMVSTKLGFSA